MERTSAPVSPATASASRRSLYPEIEPYSFGWISTGGAHEVYYEECGKRDGRPAIVLHGGPGGAINPTMRRFFDPHRWRTVLFDQRGCGKSRPNASLQDNTTWALIEDIERLRIHLGVEKWTVFGGSWGSTLALAYAITHPERVDSLILRGGFLVSVRELRWVDQDGLLLGSSSRSPANPNFADSKPPWKSPSLRSRADPAPLPCRAARSGAAGVTARGVTARSHGPKPRPGVTARSHGTD